MQDIRNKFFALVVIIIVGLFAFRPSVSITSRSDPKNATHIIDGQSVTLANGVSVVPAAPGSTSMITTRYFGNAVTADIDNDGRPDNIFILTQNTGGSGTFYYVVAALNTPDGYVGSQALLLGDRIAPQTTEMSQDPHTPNVIIVNYADRAPGESFAVLPSVGKSMWLLFDPATMQYGSTTVPRIQNKFTLTFNLPNRFSATTDCNGVNGEFATSGQIITFTRMMSTLMYCEGSQEAEFTKALGEVQSYHFTSKGELVFDLKMDSGTMFFR